ncbi:MAG TPA: cytochrome P450 [Streptosporangiaceae bacterium]|jgi:cytochrome P450|nr:cytochrome P450 [Streptosporangiaceae bacterium]
MGVREQLLGQGGEEDPYPGYARLRQEDPVCRVPLREGVDCWVISRYEDARAALADPRLSRDPRVALPAWQEADRGRPVEDGAGLGEHLLTREPPEHTRLRRLIADAFTQRRAQAMRPYVQEVADRLVDAIGPRGEAEIIADFAYPLAITVISEILGIPAADRGYFRQWTSAAVPADTPDTAETGGSAASPGMPAGPAAPVGADGARPAETAPSPGDYLDALLAAKRRRPGDDLTSRLAEAADQGQISESELRSMIFLLLIAGHEGTVGVIGNGVLALLDHPGQRALLDRRPELWDAAVAEILRYDGPMELAAWRFATEPVTIGGTRIPAGTPVVIALAAAHRDQDQFADPDRFDITRTGNPHLGFGHGVHYCVGAPLGRFEAHIALRTLFHRLPDLALAGPARPLRRRPSRVMRTLSELPVAFTPVRSPSGRR